MKTLLAALLVAPLVAFASEEGYRLDRAPDRINNTAALQNGAKLFVNYCLNCHSASAMRFNRLQDLGLGAEDIRKNLLFTGDKVGELMRVAMTSKDAKEWFGATPPDLSVIARAKSGESGSGSDYLYTYLRTYYVDTTRPTGWNNMAYPNTAMPNPLWQLQGMRNAVFADKPDPHEHGKTVHEFEKFEQAAPGSMTTADFDEAVADITAFLTWMAEPAQETRRRIGVWVLLFLGIAFVITWRLNAAYWKDIK